MAKARKAGTSGKEAKLAALDEALARGIADADAGRKKSMDHVFDRLETKYRAMAESRR